MSSMGHIFLGDLSNMLDHLRVFLLSIILTIIAAPAMADGTSGSGPAHTAPPPLTPQMHTKTLHHSGFATNPRPNCHQSCSQVQMCGTCMSHCQTTCCGHTTIHMGQPQIVSVTTSAPVSEGIKLDDATILSMNGGVGTGVNDVFVGGGGGFASAGGFGRRTPGFAFTGARSGTFGRSRIRTGFRGGIRRGFRGGRRGR